MLSEKHKHPRDARIVFAQDTHTYFIDGSSQGVTSTTTFIHSFFPRFDANQVLSKMKNKAEKFPGMSDAQIKEMWSNAGKEASKRGTEMHAQIEAFYNDHVECKEREMEFFMQFHKNVIVASGYQPYRTEWSIFDEDLKIAGQLDMLFRRPDGQYALFDWKRVKELKIDNRWEKGAGPCATLDHCNFIHYSLQLSIYKKLLETRYGIMIGEMNLAIFHPDNNNYIVVPAKDLGDIVTDMFKTRGGK